MGSFKDWWEEVKAKFKEEPASPAEQPRITIRTPSSSDTPRIRVGNINRHTATASGTNIGRGIRVTGQRKAKKCPLCATTGCIIENPGGRPKWKCTGCGYKF